VVTEADVLSIIDKIYEEKIVASKTLMELNQKISELNDKLKDTTNNELQLSKLTLRLEHIEQSKDLTPLQRIMVDWLSLYFADKTGKIDFALSDNGGKVVTVHHNKPPILTTSPWINIGSLFSGPLQKDEIQYAQNLITDKMTPGQCWSFMGHISNATIRLACPIIINFVSIEHPDPRNLMNDISSAPYQFQVFGTLYDPKNMTQTLLFEGEYKHPGSQIQEYPITSTMEWSYVTLAILSNHNHSGDEENDYTCVYRFRVHSKYGCSRLSKERS